MYFLLFGWFVCTPDVLGKAKLCFLIQTADIAETFCAILRFSAGMEADEAGMCGAGRGMVVMFGSVAGALQEDTKTTRHIGFPKPGIEFSKGGIEFSKGGIEFSKPETEKTKPGTERSIPGFGDGKCRTAVTAIWRSCRDPASGSPRTCPRPRRRSRTC